MKPLTPRQRTAIRAIHDDPQNGWKSHQRRTLDGLSMRRLIDSFDGGRNYSLTKLGEETYDRIMESGDGPEDLKQLLRFG